MKYIGGLFIILAIYTAATMGADGILAVPLFMIIGIWFFFKAWKKKSSETIHNSKTFKKVEKIFQTNNILLRTISMQNIRQTRNFSSHYELGKKYKIYSQTIYGHPDYGYENIPDSERRYIVCFYTDKHLEYMKGFRGQNFRLEFVRDPFEELIAFQFKLDYISKFDWNFFTQICINNNDIELYVDKENYDNYISKRIPYEIAYPSLI
tara:strand:- start:455 stop:1078 length:624 start_codon:yes stop_codon:yes gene_type:complete